jgi:hypothetical protein
VIYSLENPEALLFTDSQGEQGQLQDIISDGLDGGGMKTVFLIS